MKIMQSTIERGLYALLVIMFVINIFTAYQVFRIIDNHTHSLHTEATQTQQVIENQKTNANAIKQYIACLLVIKPTDTPSQVTAEESACFNNAPNVK